MYLLTEFWCFSVFCKSKSKAVSLHALVALGGEEV
jgi:hypothetical protein